MLTKVYFLFHAIPVTLCLDVALVLKLESWKESNDTKKNSGDDFCIRISIESCIRSICLTPDKYFNYFKIKMTFTPLQIEICCTQ